jgi:serine/threonine protein kinase
MDNVVIKREIGRGMQGTTYEVEFNNEKYALKRQKVFKYDIQNKQSLLWIELYFYKWIDDLDDNDKLFFMKLHNFKFYRCDPNSIRTPFVRRIRNVKLRASPYCFDMLLDLKKGNIVQLLYDNKLSDNERYSMIIQCLYSVYLMHKSFWTHNDIKSTNIAYDTTEYKSISIKLDKSYMIPTFGKIYSLIDYGSVKHKKYRMTLTQYKVYYNLYKYYFDLISIIKHIMLNTNKYYSHTPHVESPPPQYFYTKYPQLWIKAKNYLLNVFFIDNNDVEYCKSWFKRHETTEISFDKYEHDVRNNMISILFKILILFYDRELYCNTKKLTCGYVFIHNEHIDFVFNNIHDLKKVIKYFIDLLI